MAEHELAANDPLSEWVTFRLDNEKYGVNVMLVREVLKNTEIAPVPGAPYFVLGIINLRGNVVTVIDTRMRFGLPPQQLQSLLDWSSLGTHPYVGERSSRFSLHATSMGLLKCSFPLVK